MVRAEDLHDLAFEMGRTVAARTGVRPADGNSFSVVP